MQELPPTTPFLSVSCPALQNEQDFADGALECFPISQSIQPVAPSEAAYCPAKQDVQSS